MRITLELNEKQAEVFEDLLETTLQSLVYQESVIRQALDDSEAESLKAGTLEPGKIQQLKYMQEFMAKIVPQRILVAEILHTVKEAEKKTSIILPDFQTPPKGQRLENLFDS